MSASESVAIFWDYENCALPSNVAGNTIANGIRRIAHQYGSVKTFKAYLELPESPNPKNVALRSELQLCGVSLIDCPHNGHKDVADKMMIVDMMAYAIDTPAPATIILISGDRDFVYAVSVLSLRQYRLVVLAPTQAHSSLKAQANVVYAWPRDVLPETSSDTSSHGVAESSRSRSSSDPRTRTPAVRATSIPASPPPSPPVPRTDVNRVTPERESVRFTPPTWTPWGPPSTATTPPVETPDLLDTPSSVGSVDSVRTPLDLQDVASGVLSTPTKVSWIQSSSIEASRATPEPLLSDAAFAQQFSLLQLNPAATSSKFKFTTPQLTSEPLPSTSTSISTSTSPSDQQPWLTYLNKPYPAHFKPLIIVLRRAAQEGQPRLCFSDLGGQLRRECTNVYDRAGVTKLKEYTTLAEEAQVVLIEDDPYGPGGVDGQRWVSLHPRFRKGAYRV